MSVYKIPEAAQVAIVPHKDRFSHEEACRVSRLALDRNNGARVVVIDLQHVLDATTAAFARLVILRRLLMAVGRDLRLANLHDRAAALYEVSRLSGVLPLA